MIRYICQWFILVLSGSAAAVGLVTNNQALALTGIIGLIIIAASAAAISPIVDIIQNREKPKKISLLKIAEKIETRANKFIGWLDQKLPKCTQKFVALFILVIGFPLWWAIEKIQDREDDRRRNKLAETRKAQNASNTN
jgi:hypothetical protein